MKNNISCMISDCGVCVSFQTILQLVSCRLCFVSVFCLRSGNIIEWHDDSWFHCSCILQDGSCDFLYVEKLFCRERRCFFLCCILSFGTIYRHDVYGRCVLWMLWRVMLKLDEDVGYVIRHGNITCSFFLNPSARSCLSILYLPNQL
jgi:hypothetical protein